MGKGGFRTCWVGLGLRLLGQAWAGVWEVCARSVLAAAFGLAVERFNRARRNGSV